MSTIFKSLIGTLAAVVILACTAGTTLYCCHCMDVAIRDAVARQFAELRSDDAIFGVIAEASDSAQDESRVCAEMNQQSKTPRQCTRTIEQVQVASAEVPQQLAPPGSCRRAENLTPANSTEVINSAIEALQAAEQVLLKKVVNEDLVELYQLREFLTEKRQQLQLLTVESGSSPVNDVD